MTVRVVFVGKTNAGKTTLFNSATGLNMPIGDYSFTTKEPSLGKAYVTTPCVHKEFMVKDNPVNSLCIDGWRYIPIELMDLPGLIKGASMGRGLGTKFLSAAAAADAFIHVVDASGSIDEEGRIAEPGSGDPYLDYTEIEGEIVQWFKGIVENNLSKVARKVAEAGSEREGIRALAEVMAGIKVTKEHIEAALDELNASVKDLVKGHNEDLLWGFASKIRELSKPTLIVANKMDVPAAETGLKRLRDQVTDKPIVPVSGKYELMLRKASEKGAVRFNPIEDNYVVVDNEKLSAEEKRAIDFMNKFSIREMMRHGLQFALNFVVFKLLRMNVVYPVADPKRLSDKKGRVLPDAILIKEGSTVIDLAGEIHSDLAKGVLYALDVRTGMRLPPTYKLKDRDVIHIVSASSHR